MKCVWLHKLSLQVAISTGKDGEQLVPMTQQLVHDISTYKTAAASVKSLLPKAKAKASGNPKAKAKALAIKDAEA